MLRAFGRRGGVTLLLAAFGLSACIATSPEGISRRTDDDIEDDGSGFQDVAPDPPSNDGVDTSDPHGVFSANPPNGPFIGGSRVVIRGKGFTPEVRIWFGEQEALVPFVVDSTTLQVETPPSPSGTVDVTTQNGDDESTRRTLVAGFNYDPLYATPNDGPVSGGNVISIVGENQNWEEDLVEARIDQVPCVTVEVTSDNSLDCTVPGGTPGTKAIQVETDDETAFALDAYTYSDSADGFRGGLSGEPLVDTLRVLAFDNFAGLAIPGATVIVGSSEVDGIVTTTDENGVALVTAPDLGPTQTVTVAARCFSPVTFADVPVDTATIYLDPVLIPACAGDGGGIPPVGGGTPVVAGLIDGSLAWPLNDEFEARDWNNVPVPGPGRSRVAYLYFASTDPERPFAPPGSSNFVVEEDQEQGPVFLLPAVPGSYLLYAVAGIREDATNRFTAYAFGAVKGVVVNPGVRTVNVFVPMDHVLDQRLLVQAAPPLSSPVGPDRLDARVSLELTPGRFAALPGMVQTPLLPVNGDVSFTGLPVLGGTLNGGRYWISTAAATGPSLLPPLSVIGNLRTNTTAAPIAADGFLTVANLNAPSENSVWDGRNLTTSFPEGGFPPDYTVYEIVAGGGAWRWVVAAPGDGGSVVVPSVDAIENGALPPGPVVIGVFGARNEDFDYGELSFRNLRPRGMDAYSYRIFNAVKGP